VHPFCDLERTFYSAFEPPSRQRTSLCILMSTWLLPKCGDRPVLAFEVATRPSRKFFLSPLAPQLFVPKRGSLLRSPSPVVEYDLQPRVPADSDPSAPIFCRGIIPAQLERGYELCSRDPSVTPFFFHFLRFPILGTFPVLRAETPDGFFGPSAKSLSAPPRCPHNH